MIWLKFLQNQRNMKYLMFTIKKCLKRKNKFRGENACMDFKKGVIIILSAVILGLGITFTVEQSEAYHQLSDRNQT
ncbi:hypothetical protein [Bacillus paralicheniformis]|uniref:hypothetical protein n=1 Tax=Bacillus paralicheniformis TaxID=1648923 RepID=UPI002DB59880|nr:hypothetical protein [Bacillus paralicheniformis]MEC1024058.1 hypothetical protein [Bacillus paralicheniformis]MEC1064273.1 hypothetical protein [Bacillus paralicheniformis]MEC1100198.1 hypothetical protein [Bacillus paralicheniformis]MEC1131899.1 hypothetical protein [Bacillus paralicheniformis]MEC1159482.1 hypothetical protein [Bacillus paralicheniformis]